MPFQLTEKQLQTAMQQLLQITHEFFNPLH